MKFYANFVWIFAMNLLKNKLGYFTIRVDDLNKSGLRL